jgi:site-specific DNA recombinase
MMGPSNGKPAYRCCHGHSSAARPEPGRPKNAHVREDQILPHLAALAILHGDQNQGRPDGTMQVAAPGEVAGLIDQLRTAGITLTYDSDTRTIRTGDSGIAAVTVGQHR